VAEVEKGKLPFPEGTLSEIQGLGLRDQVFGNVGVGAREETNLWVVAHKQEVPPGQSLTSWVLIRKSANRILKRGAGN